MRLQYLFDTKLWIRFFPISITLELAPRRRVESYDRERIQTLLIFSLAKSAGNHSCGQHTSCPLAVRDVHVSFHSLCFPKPMPWEKMTTIPGFIEVDLKSSCTGWIDCKVENKHLILLIITLISIFNTWMGETLKTWGFQRKRPYILCYQYFTMQWLV